MYEIHIYISKFIFSIQPMDKEKGMSESDNFSEFMFEG
jgi:hypothetical protein